MDNTLRRNGLQRISDLIGLQGHQLMHLRGVGANGLQELREGLEQLGLPFPLKFDPAMAFNPPEPLAQAIANSVSETIFVSANRLVLSYSTFATWASASARLSSA
jgi:hypothetical protein